MSKSPAEARERPTSTSSTRLWSQAETLQEPRAMAAHAIHLVVQSLLEHGEPVPVDQAAEPEPRPMREAHRSYSGGMSGGLPAVTPRKLIAALERVGFVIERTS